MAPLYLFIEVSTTSSNSEGGIFDNWCASTGLKDKNGKEIYEGDIINFFVELTRLTGEVVFAEHLAQFGAERQMGELMNFIPFGHFNKLSSTVEVIGNIYENSEVVV